MGASAAPSCCSSSGERDAEECDGVLRHHGDDRPLGMRASSSNNSGIAGTTAVGGEERGGAWTKMKIASKGTPDNDRIDPWTNDFLFPETDSQFATCSDAAPTSFSGVLCCALPEHPRQGAQLDYLAETAHGGAIRLVKGGGAAWLEEVGEEHERRSLAASRRASSRSMD
mmetsp:Transcript_2839/g.8026  ORF Transcript_2839/g.8026 Transcript_2839/m.8026 type:complete len:170 (-) Transcript_2839:91-600(-)